MALMASLRESRATLSSVFLMPLLADCFWHFVDVCVYFIYIYVYIFFFLVVSAWFFCCRLVCWLTRILYSLSPFFDLCVVFFFFFSCMFDVCSSHFSLSLSLSSNKILFFIFYFFDRRWLHSPHQSVFILFYFIFLDGWLRLRDTHSIPSPSLVRQSVSSSACPARQDTYAFPFG